MHAQLNTSQLTGPIDFLRLLFVTVFLIFQNICETIAPIQLVNFMQPNERCKKTTSSPKGKKKLQNKANFKTLVNRPP